MTRSATVQFAGREVEEATDVVDLVNVQPVTFEPLARLTGLRLLRLRHTDPHHARGGLPLDLSPLHACPDLEVVELPGVTVRSLAGLEGHVHLHTVDVSGSPVDDLTPLADLPALAILRLRHTRVADLRPLSTVSTLEELDVAHTGVERVAPLAGLPRLRRLDLRATNTTDVTPLHELPALQEVVVQRLRLDAADIDRLRARRGLRVVT